MSPSVSLVIDGQPRAKERPRVVRCKNGTMRTYTPPRTKRAEAQIHWLFRQEHPDHRAFKGDVAVILHFYCKGKRRMDVDNLTKLVLDALNAVAWDDDKQVVRLRVAVEYDSPRPHTRLKIIARDGGA